MVILRMTVAIYDSHFTGIKVNQQTHSYYEGHCEKCGTLAKTIERNANSFACIYGSHWAPISGA